MFAGPLASKTLSHCSPGPLSLPMVLCLRQCTVGAPSPWPSPKWLPWQTTLTAGTWEGLSLLLRTGGSVKTLRPTAGGEMGKSYPQWLSPPSVRDCSATQGKWGLCLWSFHFSIPTACGRNRMHQWSYHLTLFIKISKMAKIQHPRQFKHPAWI